MKLLCAADLHLGRTATHLAPDVDASRHRCAAAWHHLVQAAIAEGVDAVLLAGDVVDRENRFFEAMGPLEQGLRQLQESGIPVVAVTGNHDWESLPRFADQPAGQSLNLIGRSGKWQRHTLTDGRGQPRLHIDGWSFPAESQRVDPLSSYDLPATGGVPALGLIHGDLDNAASRYAPLSSHTLRQHPHQLWLLGHIHVPKQHLDDAGGATIIYPGSPQAMDPGENGPHGAVLVTLEAGQPPRIDPVPLSTTRYDSLTLDASDCETLDDLEQRIMTAMHRAGRAATRESQHVSHLSLRLRLVGRTPVHRAADAMLSQLEAQYQPPPMGRLQMHLDRMVNAMKPAMDLAQLAAGRGVVATLAGYLQKLEQPQAGTHDEADARLASLLHAAGRAAEHLANQPHYQPLITASQDEDSLGEDGLGDAIDMTGAQDDATRTPDAVARETLLRQGWRLLDVLCCQKGEHAADTAAIS